MSDETPLPVEATADAPPPPAPAPAPESAPAPASEPAAAQAAYPFPVTRVLSIALRVARHNFVPFFLLACVLEIPSILLRLGGKKHLLLALLVQLLVAAFTQAVVAYGTIMELQGSRPSTRACIATGTAQLGRVIGVTIVCSLATAGAMMLLVVPGIIVSCMLYVVVPVTLAEGLGIRAAMKRSRELTDGRKGDICLIMLIAGAIAIALELYLYPQLGRDGALLWRGPLTALTTMFFSVTVGVTYFELRKLRDGIEVPELATAFARIRK